MVTLTRLNGTMFVVNCWLILTIDSTPDTLLRMLGGENIVVKETVQDVVDRVFAFQRRLHALQLDVGTKVAE